MKILRYLLPVIACLILLGYLLVGDYLPPRTGKKAARILTGLTIPSDATVLTHTEQWGNLNGDGATFVKLEVDRDEMRKLVDEARARGYAPLDTAQLPKEVRDAIRPSARGLMSVSHEDGIRAIVLDTIGDRLVVYNLVS